jgi:hypothetical protein
MSVTYGMDVKSINDQFLSANLEASHAWESAVEPGKFLVDAIPIRACLCVMQCHRRTADEPLDSTVPPRLVPRDGVQGRCKRSTGQVPVRRRWTHGICQERYEGQFSK